MARRRALAQVIVTEGTIIRGVYGNYNDNSTIEILQTQSRAIETYVDGFKVYTSTDVPSASVSLRAVVATLNNGDSMYLPQPLGTTEWCRGVICTATAVCEAEGRCVSGQCQAQLAADGTVCNDGNLTTVNDQCTGGVCRGSDPCNGVDCA
jgi:hypothetical protein